jgi:Ig-like domain from next to BRCA1 gene
MSAPKKQLLLSVMAVIVLLSACQPAPPTQNPNEVANQVATSVALTVAAQNAQTQAAASLVPEPTNTMLPTQTEVGVVASSTPIATLTALPTVTQVVATSSGGGGTGTTTQPDYACNPFPRLPRDNTIFRPGDHFDIKWTIVNTGKKTMVAGLDLKYDDGPQMTSTTLIELPELEPGDQYVVNLDAVAPTEQGTHIMTFTVEGSLCFPYVAIIVEK